VIQVVHARNEGQFAIEAVIDLQLNFTTPTLFDHGHEIPTGALDDRKGPPRAGQRRQHQPKGQPTSPEMDVKSTLDVRPSGLGLLGLILTEGEDFSDGQELEVELGRVQAVRYADNLCLTTWGRD